MSSDRQDISPQARGAMAPAARPAIVHDRVTTAAAPDTLEPCMALTSGPHQLGREPIWRHGLAASVILACAAISQIPRVLNGVDGLTLMLTFGMIVVAATQGARPAFLAAGLAVVLNCFGPAYGRPASGAWPADIMAAAMFLAIAFLVGRLSARQRREARKSKARSVAIQMLSAASEQFSALSDARVIRARLVERMFHTLSTSVCLWVGDETISRMMEPEWPLDARDEAFRLRLHQEAALRPVSRVGAWRVRRLRDGLPELGVIAWRVESGPEAAWTADTLANILVDMGAAALLRLPSPDRWPDPRASAGRA